METISASSGFFKIDFHLVALVNQDEILKLSRKRVAGFPLIFVIWPGRI